MAVVPSRPSRYSFSTMRKALLLGAVFALAACSSSQSSSGNGATSPATANQVGATAQQLTTQEINWAVNYTGGKHGAANPSLSPVVIGYVNQQGGTLSFPEATSAANATVSFINNQLGGIDGHPVMLNTCLAANTQNELTCAQQMANDTKVKSLMAPLLLMNNQAFYDTIGGKKPILMGNLVFPIDLTTPNVYTFSSETGPVSDLSLADFAVKTLKAKKIIMVRTDNPAGLAAAQAFGADVKALGGTFADVPVSEPGTAPEYTEAIRAANPQSGDLIVDGTTVIGAVTIYDALQELDIPDLPVVGSEFDALPPMPGHLKEVGASDTVYPDGWYMTDNSYTPYMPEPNSNGADVFVAMMHKYAPNAPSIYGYAPIAFAELMEMTKFITEAGGPNATSQQIAQKIKSFTGPAVMSSPTVKCGAYKQAPNMCAFSIGVELRENGKWVSINDGLNGKPINVLSQLQQSG
jgi:branched-chain amino acid transport system substrate-binding protein